MDQGKIAAILSKKTHFTYHRVIKWENAWH